MDSPWMAPDYRILYYEYAPDNRKPHGKLPRWVREQIHFRHTKHGLTIPEIQEEYGISDTSARYICQGLYVRTAEWVDTLPVRIVKGVTDGRLPITGGTQV